MREKPIAVFAGNYQQFCEFKIRHEKPELLIYIDRPEKALGYKFGEFTVVGTFWERNDALKLFEFIEYRINKT